MRIAISGSHRTGKSTLLAELAALLPTYSAVDEPYHLLADDGYEFSHPPTIEDFEAQLERSLHELREAEGDVLFDRCPLDLLAYLASHEDAEDFDVEDWLPELRGALGTVDLVVFVPIEARDRIAFSPSADEEQSRAAVDEKLRELLLEDPHELGLRVLEVTGSSEQRAQAVLRELRR
jgi:predicted ATPase